MCERIHTHTNHTHVHTHTHTHMDHYTNVLSTTCKQLLVNPTSITIPPNKHTLHIVVAPHTVIYYQHEFNTFFSISLELGTNETVSSPSPNIIFSTEEASASRWSSFRAETQPERSITMNRQTGRQTDRQTDRQKCCQH